MTSRYRLLIHTSFQQQIDAFLLKHSDSWDDVVKQLSKIVNNPLHSPMQGLPPELAGKVFHVHVSGNNVPSRKGYRLVYIVQSKQQIILPVFLSLVIKSQFDYDKVPWEEYATAINKDLRAGNMANFKEMDYISK